MLRSSFVVFAILLSIGCGVDSTAPSTSKLKIENGNLFNPQDQLYRQHVTLVSSAGRCSGTIMNRHWILTAAHCVDSQTKNGGRVSTYIGSNRTNQSYAVSEVHVPQGVVIGTGNDSTTYGGEKVWKVKPMTDLALLRLATDIPLGTTNVTARLPNLSDPLLLRFATIYAVGSGEHDGVPNGAQQILKWKSVKVSTVDYSNDYLSLDNDDVNHGDSGGGMLTWNSSDNRVVIHAAVSFVNTFWPFDTSGYTYLGGRHRLWIESLIYQ